MAPQPSEARPQFLPWAAQPFGVQLPVAQIPPLHACPAAHSPQVSTFPQPSGTRPQFTPSPAQVFARHASAPPLVPLPPPRELLPPTAVLPPIELLPPTAVLTLPATPPLPAPKPAPPPTRVGSVDPAAPDLPPGAPFELATAFADVPARPPRRAAVVSTSGAGEQEARTASPLVSVTTAARNTLECR